MTDAFTDDLFAPTPFEAARVVFPVSRLVCDVERFPDDANEPMALRGMGAVYVKTTDGRPLRAHLTAAERARLIETWYRPHHQKLTQSVEELIAAARSCTIVDCHSFSIGASLAGRQKTRQREHTKKPPGIKPAGLVLLGPRLR
jgi:N-formylglutamate amidohydrolase